MGHMNSQPMKIASLMLKMQPDVYKRQLLQWLTMTPMENSP